MKDNFSKSASAYSKFRPNYPSSFIQFIVNHCKEKNLAWDCGTGNGQVARALSEHFKSVRATDISQQQLDFAEPVSSIEYLLESAEDCSLMDQSVDLITVAQALHWFDFNAFYKQVDRVLNPKGILAVWAYGNPVLDQPLHQIHMELYHEILGPYWDPERRYIDEQYQTIPFPYNEIDHPPFNITYHWSREHFVGYVNTWSALKHYREKHQDNPIEWFEEKMKVHWPDQQLKEIHFPCYVRLGKMEE